MGIYIEQPINYQIYVCKYTHKIRILNDNGAKIDKYLHFDD